jgi:hypothetical protein
MSAFEVPVAQLQRHRVWRQPARRVRPASLADRQGFTVSSRLRCRSSCASDFVIEVGPVFKPSLGGCRGFGPGGRDDGERSAQATADAVGTGGVTARSSPLECHSRRARAALGASPALLLVGAALRRTTHPDRNHELGGAGTQREPNNGVLSAMSLAHLGVCRRADRPRHPRCGVHPAGTVPVFSREWRCGSRTAGSRVRGEVRIVIGGGSVRDWVRSRGEGRSGEPERDSVRQGVLTPRRL